MRLTFYCLHMKPIKFLYIRSIVLVFFALQANVWAQQICSSKVVKVSVFQSQAQVSREGKAVLDMGIHEVIFNQISPSLIQSSVEVVAPEGIEILSVSNRNNYLEKGDEPAEIILLEDSLQNINDALNGIRLDQESITWQKDLLRANKSLGGANNGVKADELEDVLDIFQRKLHQYKEQSIDLERRAKVLNSQKRLIEKQLGDYRAGVKSLNTQIAALVKVIKANPEALFKLQYLVSGVSWKPYYDIRVKDVNSPLQFVLKANIKQTTGEEWSDVKLSLTTNNPNKTGVKPEMKPIFIKFNEPVVRRSKSYSSYGDGEGAGMVAEPMYATEEGSYTNRNVSAQQNLLNLSFDVKGNVSVPSDGKVHQVELNQFSLPAVFGYACVPKLSTDIFVTAKSESNDLLNQLNGEANIYLNGTFAGKTFINRESSDSLMLTLGKDRRIITKREKVKDMSSKSLFGSNKKESQTIEISISNSSNERITLKVEDQIPVSKNGEISVKLTQDGDADYAPESGQLKWVKTLEPKQVIKLRFSFEITYPSGKILSDY